MNDYTKDRQLYLSLTERRMHFLFMKSSLEFPRRSGHDVHCYSMMRELAAMGHSISLVTDLPVTAESLAGLECAHRQTFDSYGQSTSPVQLTKMQERFRSYWGIPDENIAVLADAAKSWKADVVVVVGLNVLPYLAGVKSAIRIWYAADEWLLHHASQIFPANPATWSELKPGLIKGLYERVYAPCVDRVWVVSERDARAVRLVMGTEVDVAPNGVDFDHYRRESCVPALAQSCVFWGRLDFGPNLDAIQWFCSNVWRRIQSTLPNAVFSVYGFAPTDRVRNLAREFHFELITDLPDIRLEITKHQVVVLPFVSGAGIKNKLLEAASLSMPIIASPRATNGLRDLDQSPLIVANRPAEWVDALLSVWADQTDQRERGKRIREWVTTNYSWRQAASAVIEPLMR